MGNVFNMILVQGKMCCSWFWCRCCHHSFGFPQRNMLINRSTDIHTYMLCMHMWLYFASTLSSVCNRTIFQNFWTIHIRTFWSW